MEGAWQRMQGTGTPRGSAENSQSDSGAAASRAISSNLALDGGLQEDSEQKRIVKEEVQ